MNLKSTLTVVAVAAVAAAAGYLARGTSAQAASKHVYELRIYHCEPGRLPNLLARFRDHTVKLFDKHGIGTVGFWVPSEGPEHANTLYYIVEHKDAASAKTNWDAFRADPAWVKARTESEADGKIVAQVESIYMDPTDFSKIQ